MDQPFDMSPRRANEREDEGSGSFGTAADVKSCETNDNRGGVSLYAGLGRFRQLQHNCPHYNSPSASDAMSVSVEANLALKGQSAPPAKRAANKSDESSSKKKARQHGLTTGPQRSEQFFEVVMNEQNGTGAMHIPIRPDLTHVNPAAAVAVFPPDSFFAGPKFGNPEASRAAYSINDNSESIEIVPRATSFLDQPPQHSLPYTVGNSGFSVDLLRQQLARSQQAAANVALLSQFSGRPGLESLPSHIFPLGGLQGFAAQQYVQNFPSLPFFGRPLTTGSDGNYFDQLQVSNALIAAQQNAAVSSLLAVSERANRERLQVPFSAQLQQGQHHGEDISAILARPVAAQSGVPSHCELLDFISRQAQRPRGCSTQQQEPHSQHQEGQHYRQRDQQQCREQRPPRPALPHALDLPPCNEEGLESFMTRSCFPLSTDEDPNWLSEFHCFVRSELVEVFRSNQSDVRTRNNSIGHHQVGIRCRFCAHLPPTARAGRSSAFPSSMRQIYQSFTMMLRDHFGSCNAMPTRIQDKFMLLKDKPSQGATDSKRYWTYSAQKIGLKDSSEGLAITAESRSAGLRLDPFGIVSGERCVDDSLSHLPLVLPSDRPFVAEFLLILLSQAQPIRLMESECIGNRRNLRLGMPGFGCRYCCRHRRFGLSRMFPARRRTLPGKINDLYVHFTRCNVCPQNVKDELETSRQRMESGFQSDQGGTRDFFDRVWVRIGHDGQGEPEDAP